MEIRDEYAVLTSCYKNIEEEILVYTSLLLEMPEEADKFSGINHTEAFWNFFQSQKSTCSNLEELDKAFASIELSSEESSKIDAVIQKAKALRK